jgi:NADH-quinone oxidoreductase subunit G
MKYGLYDSKVEMVDKVNKIKAKVIGPHVILDQERCVLCSRCVRFCNDVTGTGELGIFNRGDRAEIDTAPGVDLDNNYSLNTVDICPVGALTSRDFRFQKRVWMLKAAEGICPGCATGCNVRVDHEGGKVYRLKPRYNPEVNGRWMCDKGRMTYKAVHSDSRLSDPARGDQVLKWAEVGEELAEMLAVGKLGLVIGSAHQSLEELFLLKELAEKAAGGNICGGLAGTDLGEADELLLSADRTPNRMGLEILQLAELPAAELAARISAAQGTVLVHGGNPAQDEAVAEALRGSGQVVYIGTHANETASAARLTVPGAMWAEKSGIFVNKQRRVQEFKQAVARRGNAREDWRILTEALGGDAPGSLRAVRVMMDEKLHAGTDIDLNKIPAIGFVPGANQGGEV